MFLEVRTFRVKGLDRRCTPNLFPKPLSTLDFWMLGAIDGTLGKL